MKTTLLPIAPNSNQRHDLEVMAIQAVREAIQASDIDELSMAVVLSNSAGQFKDRIRMACQVFLERHMQH